MDQSRSSRLIFVTGGSRSGKSRYAESRAARLTGARTYIATCPVIDQELAQRIARHKEQRAGQGWQTIEEPLELAQALNRCRDSAVVLVDCLTLWINNLLYAAEQRKEQLSEEQIAALCRQVAEESRKGERTVIFVTNELGMGLVPADPVSRHYRDLAGRCNQELAVQADEVVLVVSGCPSVLKGEQI